MGYWECNDPDCGMEQDAPCMSCLRRKLAAAESACREALSRELEDAKDMGLFELGWSARCYQGKPQSVACQEERERIESKLRAVLAGEGEAEKPSEEQLHAEGYPTLTSIRAARAIQNMTDNTDAASVPGREGETQ
ncbi:MAG TPA: hypothetical protein VGK73_02990 [Polyangiaceae bacterium]